MGGVSGLRGASWQSPGVMTRHISPPTDGSTSWPALALNHGIDSFVIVADADPVDQTKRFSELMASIRDIVTAE